MKNDAYPPMIWYKAVDKHGREPRHKLHSMVDLTDGMTVGEYREQVKAQMENTLKYIATDQLAIYRNRADFDSQKGPLQLHLPVKGLGSDLQEDAMLLVVPIEDWGARA